MNIGNIESHSPSSVVPVVENVDVVAGNCVGECGGVAKVYTNGTETESDKNDKMEGIASPCKLSPPSEILEHQKRTAITSHEHKNITAHPSSSGASGGSCSGPPAPLPAPLPPGYSGTMGCLDAHYPRCLMGHYL